MVEDYLTKCGDKDLLRNIDALESIVGLAYNYGLSLMELGQIDLSEKFFSKALSLMVNCSNLSLEWKNTVQGAYQLALRAKTDSSTSRIIDILPSCEVSAVPPPAFSVKEVPLSHVIF